jgi:hypothetical protein
MGCETTTADWSRLTLKLVSVNRFHAEASGRDSNLLSDSSILLRIMGVEFNKFALGKS